jgi:hypothetical protein
LGGSVTRAGQSGATLATCRAHPVPAYGSLVNIAVDHALPPHSPPLCLSCTACRSASRACTCHAPGRQAAAGDSVMRACGWTTGHGFKGEDGEAASRAVPRPSRVRRTELPELHGCPPRLKAVSAAKSLFPSQTTTTHPLLLLHHPRTAPVHESGASTTARRRGKPWRPHGLVPPAAPAGYASGPSNHLNEALGEPTSLPHLFSVKSDLLLDEFWSSPPAMTPEEYIASISVFPGSFP